MQEKIIRLTTDNSLRVEQRIKKYQDMLDENLIGLHLKADTDDFFTHSEFCLLDAATTGISIGSPRSYYISPQSLILEKNHSYHLIYQPSKPVLVSSATCENFVLPGECILLDSRRPMSASHSQGLESQYVKIPIACLDKWIPDVENIINKPFSVRGGWGLALVGSLQAIMPRSLQNSPYATAHVEEQILSLLTLATGSPYVRKPDISLLNKLRDATCDLLSECDLTATRIAMICGVSVRTLHRTFAESNLTFGHFLMNARVGRAAAMLSEKRFDHVLIAEIGMRCGFLDASHFARQFKIHRGFTPKEFRNLHG